VFQQKTLGGTGFDEANAFTVTTGGSYVLAGLTTSLDGDVTGNNGYVDYWVVKLCASQTFYADADGDDYGDHYVPFTTCTDPPPGYVLDSTDCDDSSPLVNPGVLEVSNNGIDDNCNGDIDEFGVGIENSAETLVVKLFPNPASSQFELVLESQEKNGNVEVAVENLLGEKMISSYFRLADKQLKATVSLAGIPEGIYSVSIKTESTSINRRLVVVK